MSSVGEPAIDLSAVQGLLASWWFDYDQGHDAAWPQYFTSDAHFSCRSDSGETPFEDFVRADVTGRQQVLDWQLDHRRNSPYPLRHNATNVHVTAVRSDAADFRCYLFVTQVVNGAVANLASGICAGTVRRETGQPRLADLRVILDFTDSTVFTAAVRRPHV